MFCPFEAVGMVRQEIRHGAFLAWLLDPQASHGLDDRPLRRVLELLTEEGMFDIGDLLDVQMMALDNTEIRREWRNIDLLLLVREGSEVRLAVALELKIDASESSDQLKTYYETLAENFPELFGKNASRPATLVFLTTSGDGPSAQASALGWKPLGYEAVIEALKPLAAPAGASGMDGAGMLRSYIDMMRRHHLEDSETKELAQRLWQRHREVLTILADNQPDPLGDILGYLGSIEGFEALEAKLSPEAKAAGASLDGNRTSRVHVVFKAETHDRPEWRTDRNWLEGGQAFCVELYAQRGTRPGVKGKFVFGPSQDRAARNHMIEALLSRDWKVSQTKNMEVRDWITVNPPEHDNEMLPGRKLTESEEIDFARARNVAVGNVARLVNVAAAGLAEILPPRPDATD